MIAKTKEGWRRFAASKPGHRLQERYRRRIIVAVGRLVLGVLPGPGTLTFFVGMGMIAGVFRPVARLLDWAEVGTRRLGRWVVGIWRSSVARKASIVAVTALCAAAVLYAAYRLLFGG